MKRERQYKCFRDATGSSQINLSFPSVIEMKAFVTVLFLYTAIYELAVN